MTATDIYTRVELDPTTGEPRCAHIVGPGPDTNGRIVDGSVLVLASMIDGIPVTALCGYTWVPSRDPKQYPICSRCREIREATRPDENPEEISS